MWLGGARRVPGYCLQEIESNGLNERRISSVRRRRTTHFLHPENPLHPSHQLHLSHLSHGTAPFVRFTPVTASHGLLDALTNGGRGIGFFAPFSNHRYFFPWRPIQVSPIGVGFFSPRGLRVLASEAGWIWVPSAIIA